MTQDLSHSVADSLRDTAIVRTPLPGGVGAVVRFLMNVPTWIQIGGAVVGAIVAAAVVWFLWRRRLAIWTWLTTRSRGVKIALAAVVAAVVIGFSVFGAASWHYMMHNNDFCVGCHVMTPAFSRFQHSEHRKLQCHDCHQQSLYASMRQLVLWVAEKPQKIPPHAKVPNKVCAECHIQKPGQDSIWKRISATAGHRVHLNSDSAPLRGIQCVKCHGLEVHHFAPVDSTCGQAQCHSTVQIRLAKMRGQTSLHCVKCHQFTTRVSETISLDSTKKFLIPTGIECLGCHAMQKRLGTYDEAKDPHQGVCGACHDPHKQSTPAAAWATCQNSGCHASPETLTPFHRGISTVALAKCETCHQAHEWKVSGKQCILCHKNVFEDRPPGARAAVGVTPAHLASLGQDVAQQGLGYAGPAGFSHRRHRALDCTSCHETGKAHGALKVRTVADCQQCHHSAPTAGADGAMAGTPPKLCTTCHAGVGLRQGLPDTLTFKLSVWKEPRTRVLTFRHDKHTYADCTLCHATPLSLRVPADKSCESCHDKHHAPDAQCRGCHLPAKSVHTREAHLGCASAQCHAPQTVSELQPKRNVCLVCHQTQVNHKPGKECAACHQVQWLSQQKGTT
jgi:nitrate/TMAO reductase-like tetraheme cytochrome c subunit